MAFIRTLDMGQPGRTGTSSTGVSGRGRLDPERCAPIPALMTTQTCRIGIRADFDKTTEF